MKTIKVYEVWRYKPYTKDAEEMLFVRANSKAQIKRAIKKGLIKIILRDDINPDEISYEISEENVLIYK